MADAVLSVAITADIAQLQSSLTAGTSSLRNFVLDADGNITGFKKSVAQLGEQLTRFRNQLANSTDPRTISRLNNAISETQRRITATNQVIGSSSGGLSRLSAGSNNAAFALTNLGRVAQDAPFGFIGIQNNLNPLLESFQRLRAETGSNVGALRALGQSLIGPAGIGIALSVVGAAILFYQKYQQGAKKATKELADENKNYIDSLSSVEKGLIKGTQEAENQLTPLRLLYKATQDTTLSLKERNLAVDALQKQYPSYFGNLTNEQILAGRATDQYNLLTKAILAKAKASALEDELKENVKNQRLLEKRTKSTEDALKVQKSIDNVKSAGETRDIDALKSAKALLKENVKLDDILNKRANKEAVETTKTDDGEVSKILNSNELLTKKNNLNNQTNILKKEELEITSEIEKILKESGVKSIIPEKDLETVKEIKSELDRIKPIKEDVLLDTFRLSNTKPFELAVKIKPVLEVSGFLTEAEKDLAVLSLELGKNISDSLSKSVATGLGESFASIGNVLATDGNPIAAFGNSVLGEFGSFLSQFGSLLIQYGIAAGAFAKLQASLLVPGAALISAPLAIAAGLALKLASGAITGLISGGGNSGGSGYKVPGFATGITNFGGGLALVGERGPELVNLPTGSNVITNQNTNKLVGASRGNSTQVMIPEVKISGQDLVVVFNRASNFNKRR
jgi:hypothetical protein